MSIFAQFDRDGNQYLLSSNADWSSFLLWVESLDAATYPALAELCKEGSFENFTTLSRDLNVALRSESPEPAEQEIGRRIESAMLQNPAADVLLITNGISIGKKGQGSIKSPGGNDPRRKRE